MPASSPDTRMVHQNVPLTNVSVAFMQSQQWVANQVFPQVPVQHQGNIYYKYDMSDWYRSVAALRAPATESMGGGWTVTTDSYYCDVYAVHKDLDDQIRANADNNFALDSEAARWCTQQLMLKRDADFLATYFTTGVWTGGTGGATDQAGVASGPGSNQFVQWNASGSTPIEDITEQGLSIQAQTGYRPNVLVLGPQVYRALLDNASILDRIKYSERGIVSTALLASLFEVDRVVVSSAIVNSANSGATDSIGFAMGKAALLVYAAPRPSLMEASGGYIFTWNGYMGGSAYGSNVRSFRMEQIKSDRIEGEMAYDMKVVAPTLGCFFTTAVA